MKFATSAIASNPTTIRDTLMPALVDNLVTFVASTLSVYDIAASGTKMVATPRTGDNTWSVFVVLTFVESHIFIKIKSGQPSNPHRPCATHK